MLFRSVEEIAPLRRTVTQTEVGNAAAFLCSDLSSGITGQVIYVMMMKSFSFQFVRVIARGQL